MIFCQMVQTGASTIAVERAMLPTRDELTLAGRTFLWIGLTIGFRAGPIPMPPVHAKGRSDD